ncbi:DUF302 domain-containing protein [Paracoccus tegillarcae]|uniref:Camphor resistance protein CrcB n=1 Tax=Paracoccus tegillarcae TaxID=1529068 RepID=A0A2K9EZ92_9RHOB|nr:DUF302 domain-containing protein [Paracoccus tegillarcae]AUH34624.1 camphor resistance protein CrcB [Paracoccus tegillarcae]
MKRIALPAALAAFAALTPAHAAEDDIMMRESDADVPATVERLVTAIEGAGATVFATVDHGAGAQSVGTDIGASQLVIFGNPEAGTPVMELNRLAGLMLPLKMLVYEDAEGKVWVAHEDIGDVLDELDGIDDDAEALAPLNGALEKLSAAAAGSPG